jgi:hypothetical protein
MAIYTCLRCGNSFKKKYILKDHYNRKFICKPIELDIPIELLRNTYIETDNNVLITILQMNYKELYAKYIDNLSSKIRQQNQAKYTDDIPDLPEKYRPGTLVNPIEHTNSKQRLNCKHCNKLFSSTSARCRHENHRCNKNDKQENNNIDIDTIFNSPELIKKIADKLANYINSNGETVVNRLDSNNIDNSETNNIATNSYNNTINSNNTNNNTIYIEPKLQYTYGNECFDYILEDRKIEAKLERLADTDTTRFVREVIKVAYYNPEHPENKTFKMDNAKAPCILILTELPDHWIYAPKNEVIQKKATQLFSWITDETNIVKDTKAEKLVEDTFIDKPPSVNIVKKIFEEQEITHYKNIKRELENKQAAIANKETLKLSITKK